MPPCETGWRMSRWRSCQPAGGRPSARSSAAVFGAGRPGPCEVDDDQRGRRHRHTATGHARQVWPSRSDSFRQHPEPLTFALAALASHGRPTKRRLGALVRWALRRSRVRSSWQRRRSLRPLRAVAPITRWAHRQLLLQPRLRFRNPSTRTVLSFEAPRHPLTQPVPARRLATQFRPSSGTADGVLGRLETESA